MTFVTAPPPHAFGQPDGYGIVGESPMTWRLREQVGFLAKRNAIAMLMSIEIMLNAVNLAIIAFGAFTPELAERASTIALFVIAATILSSAGRPSWAAVIAGVGLAVVVSGNYVLVNQAGVGDDTLAAAALGTSAGMVVAFVPKCRTWLATHFSVGRTVSTNLLPGYRSSISR